MIDESTLSPATFGARLDHFGQCLLLEIGGTLDHADQVGHQVSTPLVLIFDLRPAGFHALVESDDVVVAAARRGERQAAGQQHRGKEAGNARTLASWIRVVHVALRECVGGLPWQERHTQINGNPCSIRAASGCPVSK